MFGRLLCVLVALAATGAACSSSPAPEPTCEKGGPSLMPAWFEENRAHAHTRLPIMSFCDPTTAVCQDVFLHAGALMAEVGVRAMVRHTHEGHDKTWWKRGPPEAWAPQVNITGLNYVANAIEEAHAANVSMIGYHYPRCHEYFSEAYPQWINRNFDGTPQPPAARGQTLCVNSGWRDEYMGQLEDLVSFNVDGLYFDEYPQPEGGCWCDSCKAAYKNYTGNPNATLPGPNDANYRDTLLFNTHSVQRFFTDIVATVDAKAAALKRAPVATLVSLHTLPCLNNGNLLFETTRISGCVGPNTVSKIEFDTGAGHPCVLAFTANKSSPLYGASPAADLLTTMGWAIGRDAAFGRPGHTWDPNTHKNASDVLCGATAMMTHGLIANLDHQESLIPNATLFRESYAVANALSPYLNGTRPKRWLGVLFSEAARDAFLPTTGGNGTLFQDLMLPTLGAWEACVRHAAACGVLLDWQLTVDEAYLNQFSVIVVPPLPTPLTAAQKAALGSFPGPVVYMDSDPSGWTNVTTRAALTAKLWTAVVEAAGPPPIAVHMSSQGDVGPLPPVNDLPYVVAHAAEGAKHTVLMAHNGFMWCGAREAGEGLPQPPPAAGVRLSLANVAKPSAVDALTGRAIPVLESNGSYVITLPPFDAVFSVLLSCSGDNPQCV